MPQHFHTPFLSISSDTRNTLINCYYKFPYISTHLFSPSLQTHKAPSSAVITNASTFLHTFSLNLFRHTKHPRQLSFRMHQHFYTPFLSISLDTRSTLISLSEPNMRRERTAVQPAIAAKPASCQPSFWTDNITFSTQCKDNVMDIIVNCSRMTVSGGQTLADVCLSSTWTRRQT